MAIGPYGVSPFLMRSLHTAYLEGVEYTAGVGQCSAGRRVSARAPRRELASKRRQDHAESQTAFLRVRRRDADQRCLVASALCTTQRSGAPNALRYHNAYKFSESHPPSPVEPG